MKLIEHFIEGKKYSGDSKRTGKIFNPATGEQSAEVRLGTIKDLNKAVASAKESFEAWSNTPPIQRARVMFKFKELIEKNSDELTKIIVSEHGKVYEDAKGSLTRGLEVVEFACGIPHLLKGVMPAQTPKGCLMDQLSTSVPTFSVNSPFNSCGIPQANSTTSKPLVREPFASS